MKPIIAQSNSTRTAFTIPSEYSRGILKQWLKKYTYFDITPRIKEGFKGRRYLEGAVIPEYAKFQYGMDPREGDSHGTMRWLFKRDFDCEIIQGRDGTPEKVPKGSSKGKAKQYLDTFTAWATENGCKIPNPALFKLWRDQWKNDPRFPTFHDFLAFLKLDCDAMPSTETLATLEVPKPEIAYPDHTQAPSF